MNKIRLLDCTLRDGGYVNNWHFGNRAIREILKKLVSSNVNYIECGYLSQKKAGTEDDTQYGTFEDIEKVLPQIHADQRIAVMINFGEYDIDTLPEADNSKPIIRVCFHKKESENALMYCTKLIQKGYFVFVQPMASLHYSDIEFIELILKVNEIMPKCFYIVDSFGVMEHCDFKRLISLADANLDKNIQLGYHSHNNLQQAYGNAKFFVEQNLQHNIVLDASVYGMGRGAGNLNMELFASYLNKNYGTKYNIDAFLDIMDDYLKPIFSEHFWGYSLPFYLSAQYNCHPDYANYYTAKNTLTNKSMRQLLASLPYNVKNSYSVEKAEEYYLVYQKRFVNDHNVIIALKKKFEGRKLLVLAPGKTLCTQQQIVEKYIQENNPITVAINIIPDSYRCDFLFCVNERRLNHLDLPEDCQLIVSSNIEQDTFDALKINYSSYLVEESIISENPTLMFIQILLSIGMKEANIAGFDGYSLVPQDNYFKPDLSMGSSLVTKLKKNEYVYQYIKNLREQLDIRFITKSLYE